MPKLKDTQLSRLTVEIVQVSAISPDPANARRHGERNLEAITASLRAFGQQKPIVVDADNIIRAGNGMHAAALAMGWTEIAVVRTQLRGKEAAAYAIADNRTAELAEWDLEVLAAQWRELDVQLQEASGFDQNDLLLLLNEVGQPGLTDPDDIPAPPDTATTSRGDVWILGNHRLLCGDSAVAADVDTLLAGAPIHLVNCDPPYNVSVEPRSNNAIAAGNSSFTSGQKMHLQKFDKERGAGGKATHKQLRAKDRQLANDAVKPEEFDRLLDGWFGNLSRVLLPGRGFYIWGGYSNHMNYRRALDRTDLYFSQCVVWWKDHRVLGRKDFMSDHEWCYYGWRSGSAHQFFGPNNIGDVWQVKKVSSQQMVHLTEKPVELAARAIAYSSKPGENVLDLFGGSGSTLIASEMTGRRAHLMELDELYCDVIVQRWEAFTNKKAERISASP